ncbi:MAG: hypothetical protein N2C12_06190 [Planctomycetales bacterium]
MRKGLYGEIRCLVRANPLEASRDRSRCGWYLLLVFLARIDGLSSDPAPRPNGMLGVEIDQIFPNCASEARQTTCDKEERKGHPAVIVHSIDSIRPNGHFLESALWTS